MRFYVITGGTMVHVTPHFALCAPAFGRVGAEIAERLSDRDVTLVRTSMASRDSSDRERALFAEAGIDRLETNDDLSKLLAEMILARTQLSFVRTRVRDEPLVDPIALDAEGAIPPNFVPVLRHLITAGAFKPFLGKTSGHFGCVVTGKPYARIASVRKVDHNRVLEAGMAPIYGYEDGRILAGGAKPSVGEHTQHQIYEALGDGVHSIVHVHCPVRPGVEVPTASQRAFECGSVECGENTATHMRAVEPGIFLVQLDGHGPNIAFHRDVPAARVIDLIERCFVLAEKTGGIVP